MRREASNVAEVQLVQREVVENDVSEPPRVHVAHVETVEEGSLPDSLSSLLQYVEEDDESDAVLP